MKRKIILPVVAALVGTAVVGVGIVSAQTSNGSSLAQMIAQKFGLNQTQVQSVIDQYRSNQRTNVQSRIQDRLKLKLDQEVSQGKITSSQEQAIINELNTLRNKYLTGSLASGTPARRKQAIQNMQNDLKSWAQSQGIDISLIPLGFQKMGRGMWFKSSPSNSPSV